MVDTAQVWKTDGKTNENVGREGDWEGGETTKKSEGSCLLISETVVHYDACFQFIPSSPILFVYLGLVINLRASHMLGKHSTTELHSQPSNSFSPPACSVRMDLVH
ncbi:hypothetical protein H1C71_029260 [Ictidomys tridecemlineatus]|nr:hypothetical protein H1C71_029260 [Ictidomys tridecemlineatus]KAG3259646.1 hypothetical protein H1C71_029260 [Ictidomys tridecemlineatus]KAG3259647.1 hypothetical protein H1C71_029260 [Ictidomys tridecemlineatus]